MGSLEAACKTTPALYCNIPGHERPRYTLRRVANIYKSSEWLRGKQFICLNVSLFFLTRSSQKEAHSSIFWKVWYRFQ